MTLKQLNYALALGQLGSYGRVAKSMGVSQPAVSLQIQALEEELGIILFDRSNKQVGVCFAVIRGSSRRYLFGYNTNFIAIFGSSFCW